MDKLLEGIDEKREAIVTSRPPTIKADIPEDLQPRIAERVRKAMVEDVAHRIWKKDDTLWGPAGQAEVSNRLGWLTIVDTMREAVDDLEAFAREIRDEGFQDVVLLGMGGSSLAPEVIRLSFGDQDGWPSLHVLDSTDAGAIRAIRDRVDLDKTLFLVSTKSGGTIETLSLFKAFWSLRSEGRQFVAITDPGSGLADLASEHGFRRTFLNDPEIGGRYSALSYFGLVPAALMGADVAGILDRAGVAEQNCLTFDSSNTNSGLWLGLAWGELALAGRDKLTYVIDPPLAELRPVGRAAHRRVDRQARQGHRPDRRRAARRPRGLRRRPHVPLPAPRRRAQPRRTTPRSTRSRRRATRSSSGRSTARPTSAGCSSSPSSRSRSPAGCSGSTRSTSPTCRRPRTRRAASSRRAPQTSPTPTTTRCARCCPASARRTTSRSWATSSRPTDFDAAVTELRAAIRDATRSATTFGYGPRFLHSTGQLHKGGPPTGRFLQLIHDSEPDVEIPGADYGSRASSTPRRSATSRRSARTTCRPSA